MVDAYIGEIRLFAGNYAPYGWAFCNGQLVAIASNTALFSILGTYYGGNGTSNFALPDLQGRVPVCMGQGSGLSDYNLGEEGGVESVTLNQSQIPPHTHVPVAQDLPGDNTDPMNGYWAQSNLRDINFAATTDGTVMNPQAIGLNGGGQPHENRQPYLALSFIICMQGIFPPRC